jgi:hypothetical protein
MGLLLFVGYWKLFNSDISINENFFLHDDFKGTLYLLRKVPLWRKILCWNETVGIQVNHFQTDNGVVAVSNRRPEPTATTDLLFGTSTDWTAKAKNGRSLRIQFVKCWPLRIHRQRIASFLGYQIISVNRLRRKLPLISGEGFCAFRPYRRFSETI